MFADAPQLREARPAPVHLHELDVSAHMVALSAIMLIGMALRWAYIGSRSFRYDEAVLYWIAQGDVATVIDQNANLNSAPPLFALLIAAVSSISQTEAFLRSVPAIFGALTVVGVYWAARAFASPSWSLLPALLVAVAPPAIDISQYLREYSLAMLVATVLVGAAARYLTGGQLRDGLLTIALSALALNVQHGLALVVGGVGLSWGVMVLVRLYRREPPIPVVWPLVLFGVATVASAWLVWVLALHIQFEPGGWGSADYLQSYYLQGGLAAAPTFLLSRGTRLLAMPLHAYEAERLVSWVSTMIVATALVLGLVMRASRMFTTIVLATFALTVCAALAGKYPLGAIRQDLFLVALMYVLIPLVPTVMLSAMGTRSRTVALTLVGLLVTVQLAVLLTRSHEILTFRGWEDMRSVVADLQHVRAPGEHLIVDPQTFPLYAYYTDLQLPKSEVIEGLQPGRLSTRSQMLAAALAEPASVLVLTLNWTWKDEDFARAVPPSHSIQLVAEGNWVVLYRISRL